jgi:plasmid stabilization system protein ParE
VRELLERPYRIIYVVLPDRIDVIAVMHYRQLLPSDLEHLRVGERRRDPEP